SIAVLPEDLDGASAALAAHEAETARGPARPIREYGPSLLWLAYAAFLFAFHLLTGPRDPRVVWFARGSSDAAAFLRGEWWRAAPRSCSRSAQARRSWGCSAPARTPTCSRISSASPPALCSRSSPHRSRRALRVGRSCSRCLH